MDRVASQDSLPLPQPRNAQGWLAFTVYTLLLVAVSIHLFRTPIYSMDSIQYMGNALLMEETDPVRVHHRVYDELNRNVPKREREALLGHEPGAPADQNESRVQRAANPGRFAEFLPLFAIRPLYNQTLYVISKSGIGLVCSAIFVSVAAYCLIGILLFLWIRPYTKPIFGLTASLLLMITPPLMGLGREMTSDAQATLVAFASLYLIFEKRHLLPGMILLLGSIFFRTDFVVLAGPVILVCWLERRMDLWKSGVLAMLAVASVLCINHFAGDYGIKMLYYRNFIGSPVAPGEMTAQFSVHDYLVAFRSGITKIVESFFLPFLLLGIVGVTSRRTGILFGVTLAYVLLHFLIVPNWQERWVGLFYLAVGVCAITARTVPGNVARAD